MSNQLEKTKRDIDAIDCAEITSIDKQYSSQKPTNTDQIVYLKSEKNDGISLYTHIRCLLDMIIFQNPIHPIKFFEYYSERLKKYYHEPLRNPDLDFLNNIDRNVYDTIKNIYKYPKIQNEDDQLLEGKTCNLFNDNNEEYEIEHEYEEKRVNVEKPYKTLVQDLSKANYMFAKIGHGITNDEANLIVITMDQMSRLGKFKSIRYWGKIFGLKRNYYVLECSWKNEELEHKLRREIKVHSSLKVNSNIDQLMDEYENAYENEEHVQSENDILYTTEMSVEQIVEDEIFEVDMTDSILPIVSNEDTRDKFKTLLSDSRILSSSEQCISPLAEPIPGMDGYMIPEILGFGTNRKSYFVTNQLSDEWIELPLLKPHHIVQSRKIRRYFVGDLEAPVVSYPLFQGLEKHYLRAQIARITATTQISPRDYFVPDENDIQLKTLFKKLDYFQLKVLTREYTHDNMVNQNYNPLSVHALLEPDNWVHHTPIILEEGVTKAWIEYNAIENEVFESEDENENTIDDSDLQMENEETNNSAVVSNRHTFVSLSDDAYMDKCPPWKFETTNTFDHRTAYVAVKSHIWPGAFAVAREDQLDYTYCGWGLKWNKNDFVPESLSANTYQSEYPNDVTEITDPTSEEERIFFEKAKEMKMAVRAAKTTTLINRINKSGDEEKLIKKYSFS